MASFRKITSRNFDDAVKSLRPGEKLVATQHPDNPAGHGRQPVTSDRSFRVVKNAGWTFLAES